MAGKPAVVKPLRRICSQFKQVKNIREFLHSSSFRDESNQDGKELRRGSGKQIILAIYPPCDLFRQCGEKHGIGWEVTRIGRPKLTQGLVDRAIALKRDGLSNRGIICALGIHESMFYR